MFKQLSKSLYLLALIASAQVHAANSDLKVTEIMYNPPDLGQWGGFAYEFIELKNTGTTTIDLTDFSFMSGIRYSFPNGASIGPGDFIVLVRNDTAFATKYPAVTIYDVYQGGLDNRGETIHLAVGADTLNQDTIISFTFNDNVPWPVLADGHGWSIVPKDPNPTGNQDDGDEWRSSAVEGGSPGEDDGTPPSIAAIIVNEVLPHTDLPQYDAIELHNPTSSAVDISGWFLSDDRGQPDKFIIPVGTTISAGGYVYFDEQDFNPDDSTMALNRIGDNVYLFSANNQQKLTGYATGESFGAQYNGVSFGLYENSENEQHFVAMSSVTLGAANAYPKVGPVIITKIMYNPLTGNEQFLALKNITDTVVNLFSSHTPDSTWQVGGISYWFPAGKSMAPGEVIYLTDISTDLFREKYALDDSVQIFLFTGGLQNNGEKISVRSPDRPDTSSMGVITTPMVDVDVVRYNDTLPWPIDADGEGAYLQRINEQGYGNDAANWKATYPFVGIAEVKPSSQNVLLFPNPTEGRIHIRYTGQPSADEMFILFNLHGQEVLRVALQQHFTLDLKELPKGMYCYCVRSDEGGSFGKIIVQ